MEKEDKTNTTKKKNDKTIGLQKFLQDAGYDNRRNIRNWINTGKIIVNSKKVKDPNFLIDPAKDKIMHGDKKLKLRIEKKRYYIFNKPYGVVATLSDPEGRVTIAEYIKKIKTRVYPVGRLDFHSEGLILLTNDGDLTNFIISPKNKIPKVYLIKVKGIPENELQKKMRTKGVIIDKVRVKPIQVSFVKKTGKGNSWLKVTIIEGTKHIVRKLFMYSGHPVDKLKRTMIGNIPIKKLLPGHYKELTIEEIESFKKKYNYK